MIEVERVLKSEYIASYIFGTEVLHREDGPAIEWLSGDKTWYYKGEIHRSDGPAIEYINGEKQWWLNSLRHRDDGPAVVYKDGRKEWWFDGIRLSKEKWFEALNEEQKEKMLYSPDFI
jgi:hypothetical protein